MRGERSGYMPKENITNISNQPSNMDLKNEDTNVGQEGGFLIEESTKEGTEISGLPDQMQKSREAHRKQETKAVESSPEGTRQDVGMIKSIPESMKRVIKKDDETFVELISEDMPDYVADINYNYSPIDFSKGNPKLIENYTFYRKLEKEKKEALQSLLDKIPSEYKNDIRLSFELGEDATTQLESDGTIVINMKQKDWDKTLESIVSVFSQGLWEKQKAA